jgi:hypothetical protein
LNPAYTSSTNDQGLQQLVTNNTDIKEVMNTQSDLKESDILQINEIINKITDQIKEINNNNNNKPVATLLINQINNFHQTASNLNDTNDIDFNLNDTNSHLTSSTGNTQIPFIVTHAMVFNNPSQYQNMASTPAESLNNMLPKNNDMDTKTGNFAAYNIQTEEDEDEFISSQFLTIAMNNTLPMSSNPLNNISKPNHLDSNNNKTSRISLNIGQQNQSVLLEEAERALLNKRKANFNSLEQTPISKKPRNFNFNKK